MHVPMTTSYVQEIRLVRHRADGIWYGLLALAVLAAPVLASEYLLSQLSVLAIYAIAGVGMMLLVGYAGQISLGHAAFVAAGAYTEAILHAKGVPFALTLPIAGAAAGALGLLLALLTARLAGLYLAIATLAFAFIVEEVLTRWEGLTGGSSGLAVGRVALGPLAIDAQWKFYYLAAGLLVAVLLGALNLLRSRTGRALTAIRDSEISAQSMGVHLALYKSIVLTASAALTGVAGALYAHKIQFITPDQFTILMSVELLVLVVVGGLGSLHGAVLGAAFIVMLPQAIMVLRDALAVSSKFQIGLDAGVYGLLMVLFMLFEPRGLYGRWVKIKVYLDTFPFYRRATFRRQRQYQKSERLR
ncbi:MAG: branched-chain amino acid ABC transporter permease [Burkholderiaceae bacterium]|nr:branched-chain amino acid ABC transporter permease [Burkholderiaceae bacterium]